MNANEIWSGQIYAHVDYIRRNVNYYPAARPVRILRVYKEREYGKERDTTMCEVILMNEDADGKLTHREDGNGAELTRNYRARDIYARWEEHVSVRTKYRAEEAERERIRNIERERQRREYEERERLRREELEERQRELEQRKQREEAEANRLLNYLDLKIPRDVVIGVRSTEVILDRAKLEKYLNVRKLEAV